MGLGSTRVLPTLPFPRTPALAQHPTPGLPGCTPGPQPLGCAPEPSSAPAGFPAVFVGALIHSQDPCLLLRTLLCTPGTPVLLQGPQPLPRSLVWTHLVWMLASPGLHWRPLATPRFPTQKPRDPSFHLGSLLGPLGYTWNPYPASMSFAQLPHDKAQTLSSPSPYSSPLKHSMPSPEAHMQPWIITFTETQPRQVPLALCSHRLAPSRPSAQSSTNPSQTPPLPKPGSVCEWGPPPSTPDQPCCIPHTHPCCDPAHTPLAHQHYSKLFHLREVCV